ncbi:hypothetical protein D3C86_1960230 [compost metagenome]
MVLRLRSAFLILKNRAEDRAELRKDFVQRLLLEDEPIDRAKVDEQRRQLILIDFTDCLLD